jgi:Na+-driven multidrug efflux pump
MAVVGLVFGIIVLVGAILMRKPEKAKIGAILVLIFSILSIVIGGGFVIGMILGIIGGALGLKK